MLLLMASAVSVFGADSPSPDVYLITLDTLRADHVGAYGYQGVKTPALDRLARDGVRFSRAFTPSPITNSSHASILTGLNPSTHGVVDFGIPLVEARITWAELLKQRGYRTAAFIGAVILDSTSLAPGFDQGFDFYFNFPNLPKSAPRWGRVERRGEVVVQEAARWLTAQPTGPRFAWVHLFDPHDPYDPPAPFSETYREHPYDGEVAYTDHVVDQFLKLLDEQGKYRDSLIVVVGDHGEGLGEHGEETHGIFLYDSTLHVPLIIKLPQNAKAGTVVDLQVCTTDILPTVLALQQIAAPSSLEGRSLVSAWSGEPVEEVPALGETDYPLRFGWAPLRSIRAGGLKFIEAPRPEFYDVLQDPGEMHNRYEPWSQKVQELRALLATARAQAATPAGASGQVSEQTLEHLRALGYLGSDPGQTDVPEPSLLPDPKDKIELQNLLHRAMMADEDGRQDVARRELLKAVEADDSLAVAFVQLGQIELSQGAFAEASAHLARARALRPQDSAAAWYHGQALHRLGNLTAARDALEQSLRLTPGQYDARLLLGQIYASLQDAAAAEDQLEAAAFLKPKRIEARRELARLYLEQERFGEAAAQLEKAVAASPESADLFELLERAYGGSGQAEAARRAANRAAALRQKEKAP